jgi:hypothetical protein
MTVDFEWRDRVSLLYVKIRKEIDGAYNGRNSGNPELIHLQSAVDDLLFVAEDPSCEGEAGERSVYEALSYEFAKGPGVPIAVHITAAFRDLNWHSTGAASKIKFSLGVSTLSMSAPMAHILLLYARRGGTQR